MKTLPQATSSERRWIPLLALLFLCPAIAVRAHGDDKKRPPTKAKADLMAARKLMDTAKQKMIAGGRYACCVKASPGSKVGGCDTCAKLNGSCNCGANLAQGKGVCGDCLAGWKTGRGAFPGFKKDSVTLLDSSHQAMPGMDLASAPAELKQAQDVLNKAKKTLVQEKRFSCCIGQGGCDECAYEASCPCAKEIAKSEKSKGICGQCFDGQHAGHGRIQGIDKSTIKLNPMQEGMEGMEMGSFAGIPMSREASGTSWQPDSSPMHAKHQMSGLWRIMQHYNAFLNYDSQSGPRGDDQINSVNWYMLMASRPVGRGELTLRTMLSLEPATTSPRGYPLLFQSGEAYGGNPLVDRQHPHDFFMEVAGHYRHPLGSDTALSLYFAPSGEPALGPTAFPHRLSSMDNPAAPIGHHWQDSSHVTFGVFTAGVSRKNVQLEGSVFTGREPDEHRWNLDRMKFDSYSGRITYNPGPNWSMQGSYGYLHSPEQLHPDEDVRRTTVSTTYNRPLPNAGNWATTFVWGRNNSHRGNSDSWLAETDYDIAGRNTLFGRLEHVDKSAADLDIPVPQPGAPFSGVDPERVRYRITSLTLGGVHELTPGRDYRAGIGAAVTYNWKPKEFDAPYLNSPYGSDPMGFWLFLRIRPSARQHGGGHGEAMEMVGKEKPRKMDESRKQ